MEEKMKKKMHELNKEFQKISKKGYIKGICNNYSAIGRTFENELHLEENKFSVPDYYGIEIKTRRAYSKSAITLFNAVPDGENLFEIKRIKETYGYPCRKDKNYKVLYAEVYGNKYNFAGIKYQYKLDIDRQTQKVYLGIYNRYEHLIERKIYWSFEYLKEKILNKLKYLAIISTWPKKVNNWNYFKYYKIDFYILESFEKFITALEDGTIKLIIKIDIYLNEKNYGKDYDHGCGFAINEYNITKIYHKVDDNNI